MSEHSVVYAQLKIPTQKYIDNILLPKLHVDLRDPAKNLAVEITSAYSGFEINALSVLAYAAEKGQFEKYVEKLRVYHDETLKAVPDDARRKTESGQFRDISSFFTKCYKELGIKS